MTRHQERKQAKKNTAYKRIEGYHNNNKLKDEHYKLLEMIINDVSTMFCDKCKKFYDDRIKHECDC